MLLTKTFFPLRFYCKDCGSKNTAELEVITHSYSHEDLEFIFRSLLPDLRGKTLLDIGSRFGAVLFGNITQFKWNFISEFIKKPTTLGAYFFSDAAKIMGLEMNAELCTVQRTLVQHFATLDRIQIIEGEMSTRADLLVSHISIYSHYYAKYWLERKKIKPTLILSRSLQMWLSWIMFLNGSHQTWSGKVASGNSSFDIRNLELF